MNGNGNGNGKMVYGFWFQGLFFLCNPGLGLGLARARPRFVLSRPAMMPCYALPCVPTPLGLFAPRPSIHPSHSSPGG